MASVTTSRRQGLNTSSAIKVPCRVATTANITLSGEQTIDGVAVVDGDRVLVKNQTTASENGIYECDTGSWSRTKDWDGTYDVVTGTLVYVFAGTANSGWWYVSTTGTITVGTTSVTIAMASTALAVVSAFAQTLIDDTTGSAFSQTLITDTTGSVFMKTVRDNLAAESSPATDDELFLRDTSATAVDRITLANLLLVVNALTADATPDTAADYLLTYDASAAAAKKVLIDTIVPAASLTVAGKSELATSAEIKTGTDAARTMAPDQLLAAVGFTAHYNSGNQTITSAGALTLAHGLGREPVLVQIWLKCLTAEFNYSIGMKLSVPCENSDATNDNRGASVVCDATNISVRFGSLAATVFNGVDRTSGAGVAFTNGNWAFVVDAWA